MKFDSQGLNQRELYKLISGAVVPRPIAWVSTVGESGINNLAPFSYYNAVCADPAIICVSIGWRDGAEKDSIRNLKYTGDFVVNVVTEELAEAMNLTAGEYSPDVDEFQLAKLTAVPSERVKAPRVRESPINMECKLLQTLEFGNAPTHNTVAFGEVVYLHVRDDLLDNGRIDFLKLKPVGRLAGDLYTRSTDIFEIKRPRV